MARAKKKANGHEVRVRMYNVGFGDAFLVEIPGNSTTHRILFDCGSIQASPEGGAMKDIVSRIIDDVTDASGDARIDVVVATHRHKDHISGFAVDGWDDVEVKEVWMPWTEHPTDKDARRIRDIRSRMALALQASMTKLAESVDPQVETVDRYRGIVENALLLTNDREMKRLHGGFAGNPKRRFLPRKTKSRSFETPALPGVRVHVLGPSRDKDVIRDMDPPKGESFLRMRNAVATADGRPSF